MWDGRIIRRVKERSRGRNPETRTSMVLPRDGKEESEERRVRYYRGTGFFDSLSGVGVKVIVSVEEGERGPTPTVD